MSDIGADVFAEWQVLSEYVVPLSVFSFVSCGWFVVQSVTVSAFVECFFFGGAASPKDALSGERDDSLVDAGGYVLCGGWCVDAAVDVSQCGVGLWEGLVGVFVQVESDV